MNISYVVAVFDAVDASIERDLDGELAHRMRGDLFVSAMSLFDDRRDGWEVGADTVVIDRDFDDIGNRLRTRNAWLPAHSGWP